MRSRHVHDKHDVVGVKDVESVLVIRIYTQRSDDRMKMTG